MIEIEIKCQPTAEQKTELLKDATFVGEYIDTDIYYDTSEYDLTCKDFWLRKRNGKFELKKPVQTHAKHEIDDEDQIRIELNLSKQGSLQDALEEVGYKELYILIKHRKQYTKEGINLDFDTLIFGDKALELFCEFEIMVEKPEQVEKAKQKLIDFARRHGITREPIKGDLLTLIKKLNPEHYEAIQRAREQKK